MLQGRIWNPVLVGLFVIGALVLGLVGLISIGSTQLFTRSQKFVVFVNGSVTDLTPGTSVKLHGVRIGRVTSVRVAYAPKRQESRVAIHGKIERNVLSDFQGRPIAMTRRNDLESLIEKGLAAKIKMAGVVGKRFVDLGFYPERAQTRQAHTEGSALPEARHPVVPTIPSTLSSLTDDVSRIMTDIKAIDFDAIAANLEGVLRQTRQRLAELQVEAMISDVSEAAEAFTKLAASEETQAAITNLNRALEGLDRFVSNLESQLGSPDRPLSETLTAARKALHAIHTSATQAENLLRGNNTMGAKLLETLNRVDRAAAAFEQLIRYLERNPNALLTGRPKPSP